MTLSDRLLGEHLHTPDEIADRVGEVLTKEAGITHQYGLQFDNSGDIRVHVEDTRTLILVPLPFLDAADVTTDDLQRAFAHAVPTVACCVEVAPPP